MNNVSICQAISAPQHITHIPAWPVTIQ